ncbi:signal peptidase I [Erythrobacter sp. R86502]|uniref:signal peptidase I n=1 Tax=Erythrobacter sp. R86502 TaxID=3093846 RepID=UPI0036D22DE1
MDVKTQSLAAPHPAADGARARDSWAGFFWFLIKLVLAVLVFRTVVFSPFSIPSESMLPRLMNGDFLLAAKWPYGLSRHSLPFDVSLPEGRILARSPERGDIVIFKHPVGGQEYIKRVIGLPGDKVAMIGGTVILNGVQLRRDAVDDTVIPQSANTGCGWGGVVSHNTLSDAPTAETCRYTAFRETLPGGKSFITLDFGPTPYDGFAEQTVPEGHLFVMGDNRDNSRDSRFAAMAGDGVGMVPQDLLVGRAAIIVWSTDGSADWGDPFSWFDAARWDRIGNLL